MRAIVNELLLLLAGIVLVFLFCVFPQNTWAQSGKSVCTPSLDAAYAVQSDATAPEAITQADWQRVSLPDYWTERWPSYNGVVWYRVDWHTQCADENGRPPLALLVSSMNMAGQVWLNDQLLWTDANLSEPLSRSWNSPRFLSLPRQSVYYSAVNQLYFRITGDTLSSPGLGTISVGNTQQVIAQFEEATWNQRTIFYLSLILSLTLGMVCGCFWLFRRQEIAYGWYALATVFWVCFASQLLVTETAPFSNTATFTQFNIAFFAAYIFCFCIFSWRFLYKIFPRAEKYFFAFMLILVASIWLVPGDYLPGTLLGVFMASILLFSLNSLFVSYFCFRTRQFESWLLGVTLIGCLAIGIVSALSLFRVLEKFSNVLPFTSLLFAIFLSIILALRLSKSLRRIERFNEELNQNIQEAERKLELTLNNRHALTIKNHQLKERLNLAHELHDGLGSSLVRAMTQISYAKQTLGNKHTLSVLSLLRNDLRQIIDSFSESHVKLPASPVYWLAPLRNRFVQIFDDMGIDLRWEVDSEWTTLPSAMQCLTLYRVAEESLTNIMKHSQASEVHFRCLVKVSDVELQIIDNGIGFNTVDIGLSGISVGMHSMRTRIERLAGILEIQSKPGETSIIVRAPYELKKVEP
ncbi:sensor histidine kinase [Advenella mimigardefordensis]|uniref:Putative two-component sensor histidine kinase n=1 Tax=Advenella mimigardefordensis (strain DSM 17166 / LMG 22922 / DPN7) TaxID=1247726 RepID=W0P5N1_ADVMD|nr:ATP-binding protein [Advenella mimigardefordensis]AHG62169.1 putative two-component sensor histidine kinase [Advenella mimigardefordensis DPN7]